MSKLTPESEWLRADVMTGALDARIGVDREANVIRGFVLAEKGPFKSQGRGEFDDKSLDRIVELAATRVNGLKSRFTHPTLSGDGLGSYLGRAKNIRRDGDKVRGDLHFNPTALKTPPKGGRPLADYLMELAETDPEAFGSSLVLKADKEIRLLSDGTAQKDEKGHALPPLWRPTRLHASDVVDEGDAVHGGALSAEFLAALPDGVVRQASGLFKQACESGKWDRQSAKSHLRSFENELLELEFGPDDEALEGDEMDAAAAANPKPTPAPAPAPKPPTNPKPPANPPPNPEPAPAPKPARAPRGDEEGELAGVSADKLGQMIDALLTQKLAAVKAEADGALQAVRAEHETYRREREADELAAAHALIAKEVDAAVDDGRLSPAKKDAKVKFLRTLDHRTAVETVTVNGEERAKTQLSLALDELRDADRPDFGQRIPGGRREPTAVTRERKDELLGLTSEGREAIAARNGAARN